MAEQPSEVRLRIRRWGYLAPVVPHLVMAAALTVLLVIDPSHWVAWLLLVSSGLQVAMYLTALRKAMKMRWLIVVDQHGVRWNDTGAAMLWPSVAEIRVRTAQGWCRLLPHLPDRIVLVTRSEASFAERAQVRAIGSPILLSKVEAGPQVIVEILQRFTDAPVGLK